MSHDAARRAIDSEMSSNRQLVRLYWDRTHAAGCIQSAPKWSDSAVEKFEEHLAAAYPGEDLANVLKHYLNVHRFDAAHRAVVKASAMVDENRRERTKRFNVTETEEDSVIREFDEAMPDLEHERYEAGQRLAMLVQKLLK